MTLHQEFHNLCRRLTEEGYVTGRGGNCSVKSDDEMIISPSGLPIGASHCKCKPLWSFTLNYKIDSETEYFEFGRKFSQDCLPSMEYGLHGFLPYKYVVHLHPTRLNIILCSAEAEQIIARLFEQTAYDFIPYITPGYCLFKKLESRNYSDPIIFLQNHGLIVCADSEELIFTRLKFIETVVASYLNKPLYPDAACLPAENIETNREILSGIRDLGLTPRFLTETEIETLKGLEYEKHRINTR